MANSQNNWARYDLWDERHLSHDRFAVAHVEDLRFHPLTMAARRTGRANPVVRP